MSSHLAAVKWPARSRVLVAVAPAAAEATVGVRQNQRVLLVPIEKTFLNLLRIGS